MVRHIDGGEVTQSRWVANDVPQIEADSDYLTQILDGLGEAVYAVDGNGLCTFINHSALSLLGYAEDEVLGEDPHVLFHRNRADARAGPKVDCPLHATLADGRRRQGEVHYVGKDGRPIPLHLDVAPLRRGGAVSGAVVSFHDITGRVAAEQALRESEERYRLAQTATGVGIWDWDVARDRVVWDANCSAMLGYPPGEPVHCYPDWQRALHPDDLTTAEALVQQRTAAGEDFSVEFRLRTASGGWLWIQARGTVVVRDADGQPLRMMGTHSDISTRKRVEDVLQSSRNRLDRLLTSSPAVVYAAHPRTFEPTYISANANVVFGLAPEEILGQPQWWRNSLHPDDRPRVLVEAESWFADGALGFLKRSYRMRRGDGAYVWVEDQLQALRDADDRIVELVGSHVDISATKDAEAAVRLRDERLRVLFDVFPDGVVLIDVETLLPVQFNPVACQQLGYSRQEFSRLTIGDYEAKETAEESVDHLARILQQGGDDFETLHRRKDGSLMPVHVTVMVLHLHDRPHILAVMRDISESRRIREELARSNEDLEQFAYVASHDLRQPLRMITSYTQLMARRLDAGLDDQTREFMGFVRGGALRMDQMLTSLLDYSRVGSQGEPMVPIDSRHLVDEAIRFLRPAIEDAAAEVRLSGNWPEVTVSRNEVVRLFQNLIGNAVKYRTTDRTPVIDVVARSGAQDFEVSIRDNGIGIDPSQAGRLFKVFQRLHTSDAYEGTGIGLATCRKIAERHGGTIRLESEGKGCGCTFTVRLPT